MREIRYALRALRHHPGLTIASVLVLALGIGANTAVFSAVYAILLKPLLFADPDKLVVALHGGTSPVSPADYLDYKAQSTSFTAMAAAQTWSGIVQSGERADTIRGMQITPNMISMLGVRPLIGRAFAEGEENAILLSYGLWQRRFNSDPGVLNTSVDISGKPFTITGVMPPDFRFAPFWNTEAEMWSSLAFTKRRTDRAGRSLRIFARLRPDVSITQAQAEMSAIAGRLASSYPATNTGLSIRVVSLSDKAAGPIRPTLLLLLGTVGFVLLIACADIANLMLVRAASRHREIATRIALGASRLQLTRQLALESLVLSAAGGALGILIARGALRALRLSMPVSALPRQTEIGLNLPVLLFAIGLSVVIGLAAGLVPSLQSRRLDVNENLKEGGRGSSLGRGSRRSQNALIGAQVALAMVLLVCAGLLGRSLRNLNLVDAGFDPHNVLTFEVTTAQPSPTVFSDVEQSLASRGDVESVSAINHLPIGGDLWTRDYDVAGRTPPPPGHEFGAAYRVVRPNYFNTMRVHLNGRDFSAHDDVNAAPVVIINETLARRQWPGMNPIGKQVVFEKHALTIVGVAADVRQSDWTSPIEDEMYLPYLQWPTAMGMNSQTFVVRTKVDPLRIAAQLHFKVAVSQIRSMEKVIAEKLWRSRIAAWLLSGFAAIALALAAAGIYGVIAFAVRTRSHELAIRMALGSTSNGILALIAKETTIPIMLGLMIGIGGAWGASRLVATLLYKVPATDPVTFAVVCLILIATSVAAITVPVRSLKASVLQTLR